MWKEAGNKCPHLNGAFYKLKPDALFKMLDNKATKFAPDLAGSNAPTKSAESSASGRYKKGF